MNELNKLLTDAKISPVITIQDRLNQLQSLLSNISLTELRIKGIDIRININGFTGLNNDKLEQDKENQKETLRGLKNTLRTQINTLNKQVNTEL